MKLIFFLENNTQMVIWSFYLYLFNKIYKLFFLQGTLILLLRAHEEHRITMFFMCLHPCVTLKLISKSNVSRKTKIEYESITNRTFSPGRVFVYHYRGTVDFVI